MIITQISDTDNWHATVQLAVSLTALAVIVWLFLKYCIKENNASIWLNSQNSGKVANPRWIHTLYIGGIVTFIILEFIVYVVLNNDEKDNIIDTISFGATLSSLIMSIVAIIFTIVHGRNGETQLGQITQATEQLKTSANSLVKFKEIAEDIDKHIEAFEKKISGGIDSLGTTLNEKIYNLNEVVMEVRDKTEQLREYQEMVKNQTKESPATNQKDFSIEKYLRAGSYNGALALLACYYADKSKKPINLTALAEVFIGSSIEYIYGYLVSSVAVGIIKMHGNFPEISVSDVIPGLHKACMDMIKAFIPTVKQPSVDVLLSNLNIITAYFGVDAITKADIGNA